MNLDASVGRNGQNKKSDTTLVQRLLNNAGADLSIDGLIGPKTITAIEHFQQQSGLALDGRVDPGGATLKALIAALWATLQSGLVLPPVVADGLTPVDAPALRTALVNLLEGAKT